MRKAKVFSHETVMPRMSWSARNLYNTIARSTVPFHASQTSFTKTSLTMYQQRWRSKRFLRAYHGDWIPEKRFKRWFLPTDLPSFVPPQVSAASTSASGPRRGGLFDKALKARRDITPESSAKEAGSGYSTVTQQKVVEEMDQMPTASLFMRDVERRLDVVVFRSCFARSAYESRSMVVQGKVKLNGVKCSNPNQLLQPGDLISVEPSAVPMLSEEAAKKAKAQMVNDQVTGEEDATKAAQSETEEVKEDQADADAAESKDPASADASPASDASTSESTSEAQPSSSSSASKGKSRDKTLPPGVHPFTLPDYAAPFLFIPPYLEVSFTTCSTIYVRHPTIVPHRTFSDGKPRWTFRTDLPSPYPAGGELYSMAWEHYTRNAPRTRADARRIKLEAKVGRNGFETERAKDQNMKRSALRRGWGRTKSVEGWRRHLAAAQARDAAGKKDGDKKARVVA
ncbi:likely mitochondrial ribosomal protein [Pseudozyma hubeiensis SY62]|uniref:Likely mitochondrial ribosomal protein n=1 Tax=Pseudozyma hubeiensis (strain SY62) TaxID=1305764 RepID=R9NWB3_PSEHS|nr:likely mitochondrial ribosomal protein [Pseudozyma hubeiensis SY62]GAC92848.1 likely mitochondrial ribosomal protein [Pseudozyma hubeiensis SY62]